MKKQQGIRQITVPVIMVVIGLGLMAGCSDKKSEKVESENMAMSEQNKMDGQQVFTANLSGDSQVPAVTTDASGMVTVTLKADSIHVEGQFSGLSGNYAASHIHKGAKGENGGPVQPLSPTVNSDNTSGSWKASYKLTDSQISALKADSLYINVHSSEHPSGEIRGQLTASDSEM